MNVSIPAPLEAHYQSGSSHAGWVLRIQRTDGHVVALTSADEDVEIAGLVYSAIGGMEVSTIVSRAGLAVDNLEMQTLNNGSIFVQADVQAGRWTLATFLLSRYNTASPQDGMEPRLGGTLGDVIIDDAYVKCDMRGVQQYMQLPTVSSLSSKTCRARLGDDLCGVDTSYYRAGETVTQAGQQVFTASGLDQADDYFGNGELLWVTGNNAGLRVTIKTFAAGVVTLLLPMLFAVQVGDLFEATAGCRKRHERTTANPTGVSDCRDKFGNVPNYQGEPHVPGLDAIVKSP